MRASGPLEDKTRELVHLAIAIGPGRKGAVHSHTRKTLDASCGAEEIRQTAILSIPTIGFPAAMTALSWIDDILNEQLVKNGRPLRRLSVFDANRLN